MDKIKVSPERAGKEKSTWEKVGDWIRSVSQITLEILDWLLQCFSVLLVLGLVFVIFWFGAKIFLNLKSSDPQCFKIQDMIQTILENWKVLLVMFLIPLFYRTVRNFIDEVRILGKWGAIRMPPKKEGEGTEEEKTEGMAEKKGQASKRE